MPFFPGQRTANIGLQRTRRCSWGEPWRDRPSRRSCAAALGAVALAKAGLKPDRWGRVELSAMEATGCRAFGWRS